MERETEGACGRNGQARKIVRGISQVVGAVGGFFIAGPPGAAGGVVLGGHVADAICSVVQNTTPEQPQQRRTCEYTRFPPIQQHNSSYNQLRHARENWEYDPNSFGPRPVFDNNPWRLPPIEQHQSRGYWQTQVPDLWEYPFDPNPIPGYWGHQPPAYSSRPSRAYRGDDYDGFESEQHWLPPIKQNQFPTSAYGAYPPSDIDTFDGFDGFDTYDGWW